MSQYVTATGIAVSDLGTATTFYTQLIGMTVSQTITLDYLVQNILTFEGVRGAAIILMQYNEARNCKDLPVKLVFNLPDVRGTIEAVRKVGGAIFKEAAEYENMGGALIGFVKDPDGYLIELIQKPAKN
jgi:lactoylglutathione lyase